jgi:DNA-binding MarR family transcriptional regulator
MPRRLKLSPLQRDILVMLEEAGAETVGTVVATLKPSDQSDFSAQVNELVALGLISREKSDLVLTERGKTALKT